MSQKSSLPQPTQSVSRVLTADMNAHANAAVSKNMPAANKLTASRVCIVRIFIVAISLDVRELNNNAIDRRNTCNAGRRNYRSSMREDYSAVPKTVSPK